VRKEPKVHKVSKVSKVQSDQLVHKVHKVYKEHKVFRDLLDQQVRLVPHQLFLDQQDLKVSVFKSREHLILTLNFYQQFQQELLVMATLSLVNFMFGKESSGLTLELFKVLLV
jgi:hypothetical protein